MPATKNCDAMADACIEAGRLVYENGSTELRAAMRVVLFILGREIVAQQEQEAFSANGKGDGEAFGESGKRYRSSRSSRIFRLA